MSERKVLTGREVDALVVDPQEHRLLRAVAAMLAPGDEKRREYLLYCGLAALRGVEA